MTESVLQRWSSPKRTLVVKDAEDDSLHMMYVLRQAGVEQSHVHVAHLVRAGEGQRDVRRAEAVEFGRDPIHALGTPTTNYRLTRGPEGLSDFFVLEQAAVEETPRLARMLDVDRVVVTTPHLAAARLSMNRHAQDGLLGAMHVPVWIPGKRSGNEFNMGRGFGHFLLALSFHDNFDLDLEFACRLAQAHQARLTVLHVFEGVQAGMAARDRTPLAVLSKLPVSELKQEGALCPLEIAIRDGDPATRILDSAQRHRYDLVIMGAHARRNRREVAHSGVLRRVLAEAACPIVVLGESAAAFRRLNEVQESPEATRWESPMLLGNQRKAIHVVRQS